MAPRFSPTASAPVRLGGQGDSGADAGFQPGDLAGQLASVRPWATRDACRSPRRRGQQFTSDARATPGVQCSVPVPCRRGCAGLRGQVVQRTQIAAHQADAGMDGSFLDRPMSVCGPAVIRQSTLSVGWRKDSYGPGCRPASGWSGCTRLRRLPQQREDRG